MAVRQALRIGFGKTNQSKRMILFAWMVSLVLAMAVVLPVLSRLEQAIAPTVMEEKLLEEMDLNWFNTFKENHPENDLILRMDYTLFGAGPFLSHYDAYLSGTVVKNIGRFFSDLLFRWTVNVQRLDTLGVLAILYLLVSTFLAGGFIGMYARDYRLSFQEFLLEGAGNFGRLFRLSLISLVVYLMVFASILDPWSHAISVWTANERSEMTPFVHYLIRNCVAVFLLGFITLCFDYAKIRMITEDRMSALFAAWAGVRFVFGHFGAAAGLYLFLAAAGIVLVALFTFFQSLFHPSGYWSILLLFLLHQATLIGRWWLKALFYASQTQLARRKLGLESLTATF